MDSEADDSSDVGLQRSDNGNEEDATIAALIG